MYFHPFFEREGGGSLEGDTVSGPQEIEINGKGKSPFLGSRDHFALRLEKMGFSRGQVVVMAAAAAGFMGFCAFLVTQLPLGGAVVVYVLVAILVGWLGRHMALVEMK